MQSYFTLTYIEINFISNYIVLYNFNYLNKLKNKFKKTNSGSSLEFIVFEKNKAQISWSRVHILFNTNAKENGEMLSGCIASSETKRYT